MESSKCKTYREKVEGMLDQLFAKPDLTPVEIENANSAVCFLENLDKLERGNAMREEYGTYGANSWVASGPYPEYDYGDSYGRRMRSSTTGRYMNGPNPGQIMNGTYGHSIKDRMVAAWEDMMADAKSDYERKYIESKIRELRRDDSM